MFTFFLYNTRPSLDNLLCNFVGLVLFQLEYSVLAPGGHEDVCLEDGEGVEVGGRRATHNCSSVVAVVVAALDVVEVAVNPVDVPAKFKI